MIFKISSFLTLALALSSLDSVTAVSVPRQDAIGGEGNLDLTSFAEGSKSQCNFQFSGKSIFALVNDIFFASEKWCNKSMSITAISTGRTLQKVPIAGLYSGDVNPSIGQYDLFVNAFTLQSLGIQPEPNTVYTASWSAEQ